MKHCLIILFLLFEVVICQNQNFLILEQNDLQAIDITREDFYNDGSLWGYMNGGADLYLDYGFDILCVQELIVNNEKVKVEIYKMNDANSAFGIYSVKHYKCDEIRNDGIFSCISKYQYQFVINNYYVSIINSTGTKDALSAGQKIADALISKVDIKKYNYPGFINSSLISQNLNMSELFYSPLGLANAYEDWEDMLSSVEEYFILKTDLNYKGEDYTLLQIKINENDFESILENYNFVRSTKIGTSSLSTKDDFSYYLKVIEEGKYLFIESDRNNSLLEELIDKLNN